MDSRNLIERSGLSLPIQEIGRRDRVIGIVVVDDVSLEKADEPFRFSEWQRPQQDSIYQAENRGVGAQPERQHGNRCERESGAFPDLAKGKAQIAPEVLDERETAAFPVVLLDLRDASELAAGGVLRVLQGHALVDESISQQSQMFADFLFKLSIKTLTLK
jgi:hypothetical protein